ncbi:MAG: 4-hydroxy-tetrahydrodipicolinate reductase [Bacteroidia bacterium]
MKLRIALVGYGKMGKAVEAEAVARGHEIVLRAGREDLSAAKALNPSTCDAIIEFTHPEVALPNFRALLPTGVPIVTGTTGWNAAIPELREEVDSAGATFLHSSNFSIGVNVLFQLNKVLARLMNGHPGYDVYVEEAHHRHKKDAPSGTALSLAGQILNGLDRKEAIAAGILQSRPPQPEELSVAYTRAGEIIGDHTVTYISDIDKVSISHSAFNRRGFALGAVIAAEWVQGKRGFFDFAEVFDL